MYFKVSGNKIDGFTVDVMQSGKVIASARERTKKRAYRQAYGMVWQLQHNTAMPTVDVVEWNRTVHVPPSRVYID